MYVDPPLRVQRVGRRDGLFSCMRVFISLHVYIYITVVSDVDLISVNPMKEYLMIKSIRMRLY